MRGRFAAIGILLIALCVAVGSPRSFLPTSQIALLNSIGSPVSSHLDKDSAADNKQGLSQGLSIQERIGYQWALERVYWEHKEWPVANQAPKPRLEEILQPSAVREKVEDTLRKSNALEQRYGLAITAQLLQAEMDRMAKQTRQPDLLEELWTALGNDPVVIAECLARPLLVNRLMLNFYGSDQRLHQELKARAESEFNRFRSPAQMRVMSGQYSESEWVRSEATPSQTDEAAEGASAAKGHLVMMLAPAEWDEAVGNLERTLAELPETEIQARCLSCPLQVNRANNTDTLQSGRMSSLQEDNFRFYATAVLSHATDRIKIATVEWRKTDFDQWWGVARNEFSSQAQSLVHTYQLPAVTQVACTDDTWKSTKLLPEGVFGAKAVWTGTEMIIWGGGVNTGARYNPATDSWATMSLTDAPFRRVSHTAVWTGTEMLVWGGCNTTGHLCGVNSGGRYNPLTDTWRPTTTANAPSARRYHSAVWTGSAMIVWGGCVPDFDGRCPLLNTGGKYNPATDSWTAITTTAAPSPRANHTAVWSGSVMVIWGSAGDSSGGRYNPTMDVWTPTSTINVPSGRSGHSVVWTGSEMIVWGGASGAALNTGARYNPATDIWTPTSIGGAPTPRYLHSGVWTGSEMIVWGGTGTGPSNFNSGGRYNPATDSWTATSTTNAPSPRAGHPAVWTGSLMLIWGGASDKSGGRYNPSADTWTPTNSNDTGEARDSHDAVWTGTEMIVWGGRGAVSGDLNTGMRYSPATDIWQPMTTINAPSPRYSCGAVWTGLEMIVWGGGYISICGGPGTGGRYNPTTNVWTPTSTAGAPSNRGYHSTVWSGTELIVWGGDCDSTFNTGGRYNPATDSWRATSTTNAPTPRYLHSAVWSGTEMIVWGGAEFGTGVYLNTGGRYNPVADTWQATSTTAPPGGRTGHRAVWTGSEMVVWGGWTYGTPSAYFNTGGRYNPTTNTWRPTSTTNAPAARTGHSAVWTGSLMIVWGGVASESSLGPIYSNGGRYNPATDAWSPTNTTGAPSPRNGHTAVWTGVEMIVWGGNYTASGGRYCVTADPGFDISASPAALIVTQSASNSTVITVSSLNGFSSAVSLSCQGAPAGVTWSFAPNPATPPSNGSTSSTLTLVVGSNVASGTYWFPVVATSGSLSRSFMLQLGVLASGDFSVDCYPEIVSAPQGGNTSTTPRLWSQNGFNLPVTMSCSGAPAGVTFGFFFNPSTPPPDGSVTNDLSILVAASVPPGIYNFQVVGASGALTRTFTMQLTVLPAGCLYDLSPIYSDTFTESGGSASVTVTTSPGCSWQATSNADWITITAGASGVGSGTVNYTVAPKPDSGARLVRMTIAGQTYQIYQLGATCPYAIAPTSHSFTAAGWTGVVSIAAPGACFWTATSNASWITVLIASTTNGPGSVTYSVAPNPGASPRTGSITIAGLTFTVNQAGVAGTCASSISPPEEYCPTSGGNWTVNMTAPSGCAWTAFSNASWISITGGGSGSGNGVVGYNVAANPNPSTPRTGTLTLGDKTLTVYQSLAPTAIKLASFTATGFDGRVLLEWTTGFEADNLGFNVYKEEDGTRTLVNKQLIAGSALVAGSGVAVESGKSYSWWDTASSKAVSYWLEDFDLSGTSVLHGPFFVQNIGGAWASRTQATLLRDVGLSEPRTPSSRNAESVSSVSIPSAGQNQLQSRLASQQAVKITVKNEGFYRVSQPELVRAGLPVNVDPRFLQLFSDGAETPINVVTNNRGVFDESGAIEFYGLGLDTSSTDEHAYWLVIGEEKGARVKGVIGKGLPSPAEGFPTTVERRDRTIYFAALKNGERENFFGAVVTSSPVDQILSLSHVLASAPEQALVEVALQGVTQQSHRAAVYLAGSKLGEVTFDNQQSGFARFGVQHSMLQEGANAVRLVSLGGPSDISLVDYIRIRYQHTFTADNNRLKLFAAGRRETTIVGFTSREIRVLDVTNPNAVIELIGRVEERKDDYSITVAPQDKGDRVLLVLANARLSQPASIKANAPSNLQDAHNAADFVIITAPDFFPALKPLIDQREREGLRVAMVDIEDIYDEFSFGNKSVQSIKDFLSFASRNWGVKPRYVMFAGDSSFDARNYLGFGVNDIVPTKLVDTAVLETASDDWLADFNGDGIADLAVGRLPVRTVDEVTAIVAKLIRYSLSKGAESALLVADENDVFDFEQASARLRPLLEPGLRVESLQRGRLEASVAKARLLDAISRGQTLVNYVGHGSSNQWRGNLLTSAEARALTNETLPVMVMMTCLNGYFHDAVSESMAESLMKAEHGGAVAVWASSGVTLPQDQAIVNQQIYRVLFGAGGKGLTLGEVVMKAKVIASGPDVGRTWNLFGDPTTRLR